MMSASSGVPIPLAPAPPGYTSFVNPESDGSKLVIVSIVCASLSTICVLLRLYTRQMMVWSVGWDDFWIVCAWLDAIALSVANCVETKNGAGRHVWDVQLSDTGPYLKMQLVISSTYISSQAFAKISICCLYLRLSPQRTLRLSVYVVIGFVVAYSFSSILVIIFACNPIAATWDLALIVLPTTTCIDEPAAYMAQAGINIFADIVILILPMRTIWGLQLPLRQKISVSSIFAVGLLVCIISMIRLKWVVITVYSSDTTWDNVGSLIWSTLEVNLSIVCACVATLKPLANRFFPKLLGKLSSGANNNNGAYPSIPGKGSKLTNGNSVLASEQGFRSGGFREKGGDSYEMQSYCQEVEVGQHIAAVKGGRDVDGSSSQKSIIGAAEPFPQDDEEREMGVYVTRTVHVH